MRVFPLNLVGNAKLAICLSYKIIHVYAGANYTNARRKVIAHASPNLLYKLYLCMAEKQPTQQMICLFSTWAEITSGKLAYMLSGADEQDVKYFSRAPEG